MLHHIMLQVLSLKLVRGLVHCPMFVIIIMVNMLKGDMLRGDIIHMPSN